MNSQDLITSLFECGAIITVVADIIAVSKSKSIAGLSPAARLYSSAYGIWITYFVWHLGQVYSTITYAVWSILYIIYTVLVIKYSVKKEDIMS